MNDSELDQLLKVSRTPMAVPPGFTRDVWSRIEAAELAGPVPRPNLLLDRLLGWFALPPVALATCAAMVALGAWFGLQPAQSNPSTELSYIQSVSPFAGNHH